MKQKALFLALSLLAADETMAVSQLLCKNSELAIKLDVSNFWDNTGYFLDGTPRSKVRTGDEDFTYTYKVLLNFVETSGKKETAREISLDIPQTDIGKKQCLQTLTGSNTIKDLKVKVIATPAKPTETNKLYVLGTDMKAGMRKDVIGKKSRVKITKVKQEFACSGPTITTPVGLDLLTINITGPKDQKDIHYRLQNVDRSRSPYDSHFEGEDASVIEAWWGSTLIPVQCEVKVTTE